MESQKKTSNVQSRNKQNNIRIFSFFAITLLVIITFFVFQQHLEKKKSENTNILQKLVTLEGRFKVMGTFTDLYSWFLIFNQVQYHYFNYQGYFLDLNTINEEIIMSIDPSKVINGVRQTFWENSIYMDSFIPPDTLKAHLYQTFGKYYLNYLTGPDSTRYNYVFSLSKNQKNYELVVSEKIDITFDQDIRDSWVFSTKDSTFQFINNGKRLLLDEMTECYVDTLFQLAGKNK